MNLRRGLFRLWALLAVGWCLASAYELRGDLVADCDNLFSRDADDKARCYLENRENRQAGSSGQWWHLTDTQTNAVWLIVLPPAGLLLFICAGLWVGRGFRPNSN
jgi:hypothetical protein